MQNNMSFFKRNSANTLSVLRIILSVALVFQRVYSLPFYFIFVIAAATDVFDGIVARKLRIRSDMGSTLDGIADLVFTAACAIKFIPALSLAVGFWIWIGLIAAAKIGISVVYFLAGEKIFSHSIGNKFSGIFCFAFLLVSDAFINNIIVIPVCLVATVSVFFDWKPALGF